MGSFWLGVDPDLKQTIEEAISGLTLFKLVTQFDGLNTKEGRLREVASHLSSQIADKSSHDQDNRPIAVALAEVYTELKDRASEVQAWSIIVEADDREATDDHPARDLRAMYNLGVALNNAGRFAEAEEMYKRLLPMLAAVPKLGRNSEQYIGGVNQLMSALGDQGRQEGVIKFYEEHKLLIAHLDDRVKESYSRAAEKVVAETSYEANL